MNYTDDEFEACGKTWYVEASLSPIGGWAGKYIPATLYQPAWYPEYELESIEIDDLIVLGENDEPAPQEVLTIVRDYLTTSVDVEDKMIEWVNNGDWPEESE